MINFAIIGCGRIAARHAELLGSGLIKGACLAAVCDIVEDRAEYFGKKYNVAWYKDMHEMIKQSNIDVIVILTESGNHARNVIDLAPYKKHLIVEKPMALTLSDADMMINSCDDAGIKLFVVKQNRFNVPVVKLREEFESGRLGKLTLGTVRVRWCRKQEYYNQANWRGTWLMDGGVLTNQASHHIDLLEWFLGEPVSVFAYSSKALADIEAEDTAVAVVKFSSGALGVIEATTAARPTDLEGSLSLLGEYGTVEIGGFAVNKMKTWQFTKMEKVDDEVTSAFSENPPNVYGFGHRAYYEHVVDCLVHGTHPLVDGLQGRRSVKLINAIYNSVETGKEVSLLSPLRKSKLGR